MFASGPFTHIRFVWRDGRIQIAVPLLFPRGRFGDMVNPIVADTQKYVYR